ncbi:4633_t:CDS:2, partial [Gigaspora margarita]
MRLKERSETNEVKEILAESNTELEDHNQELSNENQAWENQCNSGQEQYELLLKSVDNSVKKLAKQKRKVDNRLRSVRNKNQNLNKFLTKQDKKLKKLTKQKTSLTQTKQNNQQQIANLTKKLTEIKNIIAKAENHLGITDLNILPIMPTGKTLTDLINFYNNPPFGSAPNPPPLIITKTQEIPVEIIKEVEKPITQIKEKWEEQGFGYQQVKNWLNIGLSPQDSDFATEYLQETANSGNGKSAREKISAFNKKEQELEHHFALKRLAKAKNKLVNKLGETELANICQKQVELTQLPAKSAILPFPALSNEEIAKETLKSWFEAVEKNDTETILTIFQHHPEIINSYDEDGNGALHNAVHEENLALVETLLGLSVNRLLEKKANPNAKSLGGNTPCHFAAGQNDLPLLRLLVKYGGNINDVNNRPEIKTEIKTEDDFTVEDVFLQRDYSYAEHYNEL